MSHNADKMIQAHTFVLRDIKRKKFGLISIIERQLKDSSKAKMKKFNGNPIDKRPLLIKPQSQPNLLLRTFPMFNNNLFIPKTPYSPCIKHLKQNKLHFSRTQSCFKQRTYVINQSHEKRIPRSEKYKQQRSINRIHFNPQGQTVSVLKIEEYSSLKKDSLKSCIGNNGIKPLIDESKGCMFDYCFQTIKNEALSFSQTVYCAFEKVIDMNDYSVFGLYDGYGRGGKIIARHFKNYFKKYILNKANYSKADSPSKLFNLLTKDDYAFIRNIFKQYKSIMIDLAAYSRFKESGVALFLIFTVKNKIIYLSLGDIRAFLISKKVIAEREHMIINSIGINLEDKQEEALWENQIVKLTIHCKEIDGSNESILVGTSSLINQYSTVNAFARHINICINKESATSIVNDLILLQKNKAAFNNECIIDGGLGLIIFN